MAVPPRVDVVNCKILNTYPLNLCGPQPPVPGPLYAYYDTIVISPSNGQFSVSAECQYTKVPAKDNLPIIISDNGYRDEEARSQ